MLARDVLVEGYLTSVVIVKMGARLTRGPVAYISCGVAPVFAQKSVCHPELSKLLVKFAPNVVLVRRQLLGLVRLWIALSGPQRAFIIEPELHSERIGSPPIQAKAQFSFGVGAMSSKWLC
jgi:hypothetical protein